MDYSEAVDNKEEIVSIENNWKCFCLNPSQGTSTVRPRSQSESVGRCMVASYQSLNVLISLSLNSGSFTENLAFDYNVLTSIIKILLDEQISPSDKKQAVNLLNKHKQIFPGCCASLVETYYNFILKRVEEFQDTTTVEKILRDIEDILLKGDTSCINFRMSRTSRQKKKSEDFYDEEDMRNMTRSSRNRTRNSTLQEVPDVTEVREKNPIYRFAALDFCVQIMKHELLSKCQTRNKEAHTKSIAAAIFLQYDYSGVSLNENVLHRFFEIYRSEKNDVFGRRVLEELFELISNLCLYADCGDLVVAGDITCSKTYPLSTSFCQHFIHAVFRRTSSEEWNDILKNIKPEWLRLNCSMDVLKRSGVKHVNAIIDQISETYEACTKDNVTSCENSDVNSAETKFELDAKGFKKIFKKKLTEETALILLNFFNSYSVVYGLRDFALNNTNVISDEFNHLHDVYSNYCKFKILIKKLVRIENCPEYVIILLYV